MLAYTPVGFDGPTGTVVPQLALAALPALLVLPVLPAVEEVDDDPDEHAAAAKAATSSATASRVHVCLPRDVSRTFMGHSSLSVGRGFGC
jgi:hypothetical protein